MNIEIKSCINNKLFSFNFLVYESLFAYRSFYISKQKKILRIFSIKSYVFI